MLAHVQPTIRGPGVVGEQPILPPGRSFSYQSACPLFTTQGTMEGSFEMVLLDDSGGWGARFEARVGRFALRAPTPGGSDDAIAPRRG